MEVNHWISMVSHIFAQFVCFYHLINAISKYYGLEFKAALIKNKITFSEEQLKSLFNYFGI